MQRFFGMNEVIEGPHGSKVVFPALPLFTNRIELDRLQRVREPVSRSKTGVQGKVADVIRGRSRHAESQNELKAFQILLATARADAWQEQPFILEYHHEGANCRYTPDVLVIWGKQASGSRRDQGGLQGSITGESGALQVHRRATGRVPLLFPALEEI